MKKSYPHIRAQRDAIVEMFGLVYEHSATLTSKQITAWTGIRGADIRKVAAEFPQTFLGTNEGYKLVREATTEEVEDNIRTLMSRAEKILHRARSLQRYALERNKAERRTHIRQMKAMELKKGVVTPTVVTMYGI